MPEPLAQEVLEHLQADYLYPEKVDSLPQSLHANLPPEEGVPSWSLLQESLRGLDDPTVRLLDSLAFVAFQHEVNGSPHLGIGLPELMGLDLGSHPDTFTVIAPVPGSPAHRAGIRAGDHLLRINEHPTAGRSLQAVMQQLRQAPGTSLALKLARNQRTLELEVITDSIVPPPPLKVDTLQDQGRVIAYAQILRFDAGIAPRLQRQLDSLEAGASITGLVLDLRNNPGGRVEEALNVAGLLLGEQVVAELEEPGQAKRRPLRASGPPAYSWPVVALINPGTASAAELLAGALQAHERALLIGKPTRKKGYVYRVAPLSNGGGLIFPQAKAYTPGGTSILKSGVRPDQSTWPDAEGESVIRLGLLLLRQASF